LRAAAPHVSGIAVLGPAEAPIALVRGRYRFRLLVHGRRNSDMQAFLKSMLSNGPKARGTVQVQLDVDPQSFL
jgi:primosomal protein N' (replication factor Y)